MCVRSRRVYRLGYMLMAGGAVLTVGAPQRETRGRWVAANKAYWTPPHGESDTRTVMSSDCSRPTGREFPAEEQPTVKQHRLP